MYEELLDDQLDDIPLSRGKPYRNYFDEADGETFITSKELKKEEDIKAGNITFDEEPETIQFKRLTPRRKHKYTEQEMEAIKASCKETIVHDYGPYDWYHMPDEERRKNDELAEISLKLAKLKRTYRRVDQYIEAMRVVYEAWELLAKNNYLHSKKEFFELVSKGKIVSSRIILPILKRANSYNTDMIIGYISNPDLDVSHLAPKKEEIIDDLFLTDEEIEAREKQGDIILSDEDKLYIAEHEDDPEEIKVELVKPKLIKSYNARKLKRNKKESKKAFREREDLAMLLKKVENSSHYKSFNRNYMITNSVFELEKEEVNELDKLRFNGSWSSDDDVALYDIVSNEKLMEEKPPFERYLTYEDRRLDNFFKTLEAHDVSTLELRRKMANSDSNIIKEAITKKENRKREASIIARIVKLNESKKFKKIASRAEEALSEYNKEE